MGMNRHPGRSKPRPPKKPQGALQYALDMVAEFLRDRQRTVAPPNRALSRLRAGADAIELDRNSIREFHELRAAFERYAELRRSLTVRTVHSLVEHAIVGHFEHGDVDRTVKFLRTELERPAKAFTVYVPVVGFDKDSVPGHVGGIGILPAEQVADELLRDAPPAARGALELILARWPDLPPPVPGAVLAVQVDGAAEGSAATEIALERASRLVDVLHFFADGPEVFHGGLWLAETRGPRTTSMAVAVDGTRGTIGAMPIRSGSLPPFFLSHLGHDPAWEPTNAMLANSNPNEVQSLLITSMAWSGRATRERRRDLAFAQFAIALESLMVPSNTNEVTDRLATRVTRLLAPKLRDREAVDLYRDVKDYYQIRSKIVHVGARDISNVDVFGLHMLTKWVTRRMVRVCDELGFSKLNELDSWLVRLVLGTVVVPEPSLGRTHGDD